MDSRPWPPTVDRLLDPLAGPPTERMTRSPARWAVGPPTLSGEAEARVTADVERTVWRFDDDAGHPGAEAEARWLTGLAATAPFAVPRVVGADEPWLVTEAPSGRPADRPDFHPEPGALAEAIGAGLAALHALTVEMVAPPWSDLALVVDRPWASLIERCGRAVAAGRVDAAALPSPYDRYRPERLLELLATGVSDPGPRTDSGASRVDDAVLCHGRPTLDRFLIDGGRFVGFDGFGEAVVADRHLDLAIAHLGVADVLGAEAVFAFYEGYGADPDLARLDRAVLAAHLLGTGPAPPATPPATGTSAPTGATGSASAGRG